MFGTLRYDKKSSNPDFIERSNGAQFLQMGGRGLQHFACNLCRSKKLRCNGQKSGCDRCKATKNTCEYSENWDGKGARRRKRVGSRDDSKATAPLEDSVPRTSLRPMKEPIKPAKAVPQTQENGIQASNAEDTNMSGLLSPFGISRTFDEDSDGIISDQTLFSLLPDADLEELDGFSAAAAEFQFHMEAEIYPPNFTYNSALIENNRDSLDVLSSEMAHMPTASPSTHFHPSSPDLLQSPLQQKDPSSHQRSVIDPPPARVTDSRDPRQALHDEDSSHSLSHSQESCQCLQTIVSRLEELENQKNTMNSNTLDSVLATHKEGLKNCNAMLQCAHCSARSENMMLLALICEKLVTLSEKLVSKYLQQAKHFQPRITSSKQNTSKGGRDDLVKAKPQAQISFGEYYLDPGLGWEYVIRILILLELRSLKSFMASMKDAASAICGTQLGVLQAAQRRLATITMVLTQCDMQSEMA